MFRTFLLYLLVMGVLCCQNLEVSRPINKQKQVFLKESVEQKYHCIEQSLFRQAIQRDEKLSLKAHRRLLVRLSKKHRLRWGYPIKAIVLLLGIV